MDEITNKLMKGEKIISTSGDFIFRDIQLFVPEAALIVITFCASIFGFVLVWFMNSINVEALRSQVSQQGFNSLNTLIMNSQIYYGVLLLIPLFILTSVFTYKYLFLMPNKDKRIVIRAWKNNMIRFSVEKPKENYIRLDPRDESTTVWVGNERKATDLVTGKPVLLIEEGETENSYINKSTTDPEKQKDINNVRLSIWSAATRYQRYIDRQGNGFLSNPTNILIIIVLVLVVIIAGYMIFMQPNQIIGQIQSLTAPAGAVVSTPKVV